MSAPPQFAETMFGPFAADYPTNPPSTEVYWYVTARDANNEPVEVAWFLFEEDALAFAYASNAVAERCGAIEETPETGGDEK
jgi:hypothetical protein